jgi:glycosyltransferase involved in cell wall biosynthesis
MSLSASEMRIIWIVPKFPLGTPDGARHATRALIHHLVQLGVVVDLICLVPSGDPANAASARAELGVVRCSLIARSRSKLLPLPSLRTPFTFRTFAAPGVRRTFKKVLAYLMDAARPTEDTFLVFDGLHTFGALRPKDLQDLSGKCQRIIYRAHNVESVLWDQCAERARWPWLRWFFQYQATLVRRFECRIARRVSFVASVSEEDARRFERLAPGSVAHSVPIGMDFPVEDSVSAVGDSEKLKLLFIGRLDWLPNRTGLIWFLENIWPNLIARRRTELQIAGTGDGRWLQKYQDLPGIEMLGRVGRIEPLYQSCALSIAPLFQGSGTRVKIVESAGYARPVLTTSLGAEGTGLIPGTSYFRAETPQEWLSLLGTLTIGECRRVGLEASRAVREQFDGRSIAERFVQRLGRPGAQSVLPVAVFSGSRS